MSRKSNTKRSKAGFFERFANWATRATGTSPAFIMALAVILVWAVTGPLFGFSETWQLIINTGTTIITFLMVFLIQKSQNKDSKAIHLKLNELIAALEGTSNRMVDIEDLTEAELDQLHKFYSHLSVLAKKDADLLCSHSIDAADEMSDSKIRNFSELRKKRLGKTSNDRLS
jgi:low affinity Fe/Cu permease